MADMYYVGLFNDLGDELVTYIETTDFQAAREEYEKQKLIAPEFSDSWGRTRRFLSLGVHNGPDLLEHRYNVKEK